MHRSFAWGLSGLVGASALLLGGGAFAQQAPRPAAGATAGSGIDEALPGGRLPRQQRAQRPQRRAGTGRTYGHPPGFGAGRTGFVSTNAPRPPEPASPERSDDPLAALTAPAPLATRPVSFGAAPEAQSAIGRPASPRPGVTIAPILYSPALLGQRTWPVDDDPFGPLGVRAGSFIVRPAVEAGGGYDSNPARTPGGRGSWFYQVAPEIQARSDWSRHELTAVLRGTYIGYDSTPSMDRPTMEARANASPDLPAGIARLPIYTTVGSTGGLTHRFNRLEVTLKGNIDRVSYENSKLLDGSTVSNRDRDYDQYGMLARVAYEVMPGFKPFAEFTADTRLHDLKFDRYGLQRNSDGITGRAGTTFAFSPKLIGEASVGYLTRTYKDPTLPDLGGLIFDGSLVWQASGLTTAKLTARSTADETVLPGVSGVLRRDGALQVDHAFRRWLIGTATVAYGLDTYRGDGREDQRYLASIGVLYKLNRDIYVKGELRREWMRSNVAGVDYDANIAMLTVRLQR
ncbi:MAG: outer membrane beta-barrel protein [Rhizobiales bacterium]|nr:outer membrane beta-barrel protein [Hyphomicrobiales bacterium]